ncbi:MAG: transketolase [Aggregatilineales bacterium]
MPLDVPAKDQTLDELSINTIRFLAVDAVQKANSGHPGLPLDAAPMAYALWMRFMRFNPRNPNWANRDRFVLSAGHGSMLLYALLHLTGYDVSMDDLKQFRQWDSDTPGHPERGDTPGVETTTGPLGQGFANGVGMAMAEAFLAATFNRPGYPVVDHYTYVIASDGDFMEGVSSEAASLAGHLKLHKLIVLYDDNKVSLSAKTDITFTEDVIARFRAYDWHTELVADGNDVDAISAAIKSARDQASRPSLIAVRTILGYGSPKYAGTPRAHGEPLGKDEVAATKANLGWPVDQDFYVPGAALEHFHEAIVRGGAAETEWNAQFEKWMRTYPELADSWHRAYAGELAPGWDADLPSFPAGSPAMATRDANGQALNAIAKHVPTLIGGDADLSTSTKTTLKDAGDFEPGSYGGRNLHFGVREHAMGSIINGLAAHGGIIKPFTATFLTFSDYMRPPIRLAALMGLPSVFVFTHDSIGLGEDGPTHQPIEQIPSLRAMPCLITLRPADANEAVEAWRTVMSLKGPAVLAFTRQKLPVYSPDGVREGVARGAYIKSEAKGGSPEVLLLSAGSEVSLAMQAQETLAKAGIKARVVSMPSWELFRQQDQAYRDQVLPPAITARVAIEAASALGWHEWVGLNGKVIALDRFGASAPYETVYAKLGITADAMVEAAKSLLHK